MTAGDGHRPISRSGSRAISKRTRDRAQLSARAAGAVPLDRSGAFGHRAEKVRSGDARFSVRAGRRPRRLGRGQGHRQGRHSAQGLFGRAAQAIREGLSEPDLHQRGRFRIHPRGRERTFRLDRGLLHLSNGDGKLDTLTRAQRSERMSRVRGKDSKAELTVRRLLHAAGYRFRLHRRDLPGKPDIVLPSRRKAIFVHGCFWHRHPDPLCPFARLPKSRREFWLPKLEGNRQRDLDQQCRLKAAGWQFLVVWECELRHIEQVENATRRFLENGDVDASG